jgi:hypothetical protein
MNRANPFSTYNNMPENLPAYSPVSPEAENLPPYASSTQALGLTSLGAANPALPSSPLSSKIQESSLSTQGQLPEQQQAQAIPGSLSPISPPNLAQQQATQAQKQYLQDMANQLSPNQQQPLQNTVNPPSQEQAAESATQAQKQYLQDMANQLSPNQQQPLQNTVNPPSQAQPAEPTTQTQIPDKPAALPQESPASQSGNITAPSLAYYDHLNQILMTGEPRDRWEALEAIRKTGFAPPETYNILCQTSDSNSPWLSPDMSEEARSRLRQASLALLGELDSSQNAGIPAIAALRDPQTGKQLKDQETGKRLSQMVPGLPEAFRILGDQDENPVVQAAAVRTIQNIIDSHPNDAPMLRGMLKGIKVSDSNVHELVKSVQNGTFSNQIPMNNGNLK